MENVGRNGFGYGSGGAAGTKEPAGHFLSGADLGEGAVLGRVEVDLEGLLVRADDFSFHIQLSAAFATRCNCGCLTALSV